MQVRSFLERYPPFDQLSEQDLDRVVGSVQIEYFAAGAPILFEEGEPSEHLYVVRTGAVEVLDEGRPVDLLGEGESFGHGSMLSGLGPAYGVRANEDTICYLIPRPVAEAVLGTTAGLAFLAATLRERAAHAVRAGELSGRDPRHTQVRALLRREVVTVDAGTSIQEAARRMATERISSVVVTGRGELGIVTDRDLRSKVLGRGRSVTSPVGEVASSPIVSASADTTVEEAILLLLDRGIHHLPITSPEGDVIGMLTDTDLLDLARADAFAIHGTLARAPDRDAVASSLRALPDVIGGLVDADIDPLHVGHVVASSIDTATTRLLELAMDRLGDPPSPWAWLALGSQARREQALKTDQDHALAYEPGTTDAEGPDRYFAEIARDVIDGLEAGGIPRCRGGVMADNPLWRKTVAGWTAEFRARIAEPSTGSDVFTSIAFDYRRVAGGLAVERPIDEVVRGSARSLPFVRRLAKVAIEIRPPTGLFRDLVVEASGDHAGTLDVKAGGITPLTCLARAFAARAGLTGNGTLQRFEHAVDAGILNAGLALDLVEAFRLLWRIRLRHQVDRVHEGVPADDHVAPADLASIPRVALKEALRTIASAQRVLARELGLSQR